MMIALHDNQADPADARPQPEPGPLNLAMAWAGLIGAGLVAVLRLFEGKDQAAEVIDEPPLEAEPGIAAGFEELGDVD